MAQELAGYNPFDDINFDKKVLEALARSGWQPQDIDWTNIKPGSIRNVALHPSARSATAILDIDSSGGNFSKFSHVISYLNDEGGGTCVLPFNGTITLDADVTLQSTIEFVGLGSTLTTIDMNGYSMTAGSGVKDVEFNKVKFTGTPSAGSANLTFTDMQTVRFWSCRFEGLDSAGKAHVKLDNSNVLTFDTCYINESSTDAGIGLQLGDQDDTTDSTCPSLVIIKNSVFAGLSQGITIEEGKSSTAVAIIFINGCVFGISLDGSAAYQGSGAVAFEGNGGVSQVLLEDNSFYGLTGNNVIDLNMGTACADIGFRNNYFTPLGGTAGKAINLRGSGGGARISLTDNQYGTYADPVNIGSGFTVTTRIEGALDLSENSCTIKLADNLASALDIAESTNSYLKFVTTDSAEKITLGKKLEAGLVEIEGSAFDINGGAIDGVTMATSDITVGTGKTLDVSAGTLTLADGQISADKIADGSTNAIPTLVQETAWDAASAASHTQGTDTTLGTMTADINMGGSYQVVSLQAPAAAGEAIRQTTKITEANMEAAHDHVGSDGSGHAAVATNTTHSGGDGSDHSKVTANETAIALNTTHRGSDGKDHADVVTNTAGIATNVTAIALNTTHRSSSGTDHTYINQDVTTTGTPTFGNTTVGTLGCGEITVANGSGINLQEDITFTGATTENLIKFPDNLADALSFKEGANPYMTFVTTNAGEKISLAKNLETTGLVTVNRGTGSFGLQVQDGSGNNRVGLYVSSAGDGQGYYYDSSDNLKCLISASGESRLHRDADVATIIGRARVGYTGWTDYAGFSHYDRSGGASPSDFALMQSTAGITILNSGGSQNLYLRVDNNAITDTVLTAAGDLSVDGCVTDGTCEIFTEDAISIIKEIHTHGDGTFDEYGHEHFDMKWLHKKYPYLVVMHENDDPMTKKKRIRYGDKLGAKSDLNYRAILQLDERLELLEKENKSLKAELEKVNAKL